MKISFVAGVTLGALGTAYAMKKKKPDADHTMVAKGKNAVKRKFVEILD